jgi:hypothetical protein
MSNPTDPPSTPTPEEVKSFRRGFDFGIASGDSDPIKTEKINASKDLYRYVLVILGTAIILVILVTGFIIWKGIGLETPPAIPDGLIAIGSAAVGAIAGLLAQPPASSGK